VNAAVAVAVAVGILCPSTLRNHDNAVGSGVTSSFAHTFLLNGIIEESCRCCPVSVLINLL